MKRILCIALFLALTSFPAHATDYGMDTGWMDIEDPVLFEGLPGKLPASISKIQASIARAMGRHTGLPGQPTAQQLAGVATGSTSSDAGGGNTRGGSGDHPGAGIGTGAPVGNEGDTD